jgi:hypothetical protein
MTAAGRPILHLSPARPPGVPYADRLPRGVAVDPVAEDRLTEWRAEAVGTLIVPMHADQRLFARQGDWLARFFAAGGTLVFNGLLAHPFRAELGRFRPIDRPRLADLSVTIAADHPLHAGVVADDLTFRRGVAGFYGRGANPPPPDALVLATLGPARVPVDWLWHPPEGGCLLMHAGNDLWMQAGDATSAARLLPNLLNWATTTMETA